MVSQAKANVRPRKDRSKNTSVAEGGLAIASRDLTSGEVNGFTRMTSRLQLLAIAGGGQRVLLPTGFTECFPVPWSRLPPRCPAEECSPCGHSFFALRSGST